MKAAEWLPVIHIQKPRCNISLRNRLLRYTCCNNTGFDLFFFLSIFALRSVISNHRMKQTFIPGGKTYNNNIKKKIERKTKWKSEAAAAVWKGIFHTAAQMGLWEELFRGSCPSPHAADGLHDLRWSGFVFCFFSGQNHLGTGSSSKAGTRVRREDKTPVYSQITQKLSRCYIWE